MDFHAENTRLQITLQRIANDIVNALNYSGCMVAVLEEDGALPVRAFQIDPKLASREMIISWEKRLSTVLKKPISLSDPEIARIYINDKAYSNNLSYQAFNQRQPIVKDDLFSLFTPIVPKNSATTTVVNSFVQPALGIKQVVAIPFFLDSENNNQKNIVGNLFAAKSTKITEQDIEILMSFGRHAAAAIKIEQHRAKVLLVAKNLTTEIQTNIRKESDMLQQIAEGVVKVLGYVGTMVATYKPDDDSLPVEAFHIDPSIASREQILTWEKALSIALRRDISITNPKIAKVYVDNERYKDNLSVKAVKQVKPVVSNDLSSLFIPIIPINRATRPIVHGIQKFLRITQVIAIPFFLRAPDGNDPQIVGNLFAATVNPSGFQKEEIELLQAFGQQAAAGIFNAQLYREIDEQREVAQVFATMAFSATKIIHTLRNDIGVIRGHLSLLEYFEDAGDDQKQEIISSASKTVLDRIGEMSSRLNQLHEPWKPVKLIPTDIDSCLMEAKEQALPTHSLGQILLLEEKDGNLPQIITAADMLTEAFRILIKNAYEAIQYHSTGNGKIIITTKYFPVQKRIEKSIIGIKIEDNGHGIREENLKNVFKMGWSTKEDGLGFGLFWTKDFIEKIGGIIKVESVWQQSTTFRIYLPKNPEKITTYLNQENKVE